MHLIGDDYLNKTREIPWQCAQVRRDNPFLMVIVSLFQFAKIERLGELQLFRMSESLLGLIVEHGINDFKALAGFNDPKNRGVKKPLWTIGAVHKEFRQRLVKLIGPTLLKATFESFLNIEELKETQAAGSIAVICPNDSEMMEKALQGLKLLPNYHREIWIVPRYGTLCQKAVENSGIEDKVTVKEFHTDLLLLEDYFMLVHTPHCFRRVFGEGDIDDLTTISRALVKCEILNGVFPHVYTFGDNAAKVKHILGEMKAQIGHAAFTAEPQFESLIILDRTVDLLTPLLSPMIYGAILNDLMQPDTGFLDLPEDLKPLVIIDEDGKEQQLRTIELNDKDGAYREIRGLTIENAIEVITQRINAISDCKKQLKPGMDINTFKIQKAKGMELAKLKPYLTCHMDIMIYLAKFKAAQKNCQAINTFEYQSQLGLEVLPPNGEENMNMDEDWIETLRQYAIVSASQRGLKSGVAKMVRRRLVERFGLPVIGDILKMERSKVMYQEPPPWNLLAPRLPDWDSLKSKFKLQVDKDDKEDIGMFFDGFVPLICRLVQLVCSGKSFSMAQTRLLTKNNTPFAGAEKVETAHENKRVMVFVIGGLTETEISCIRALGRIFYQGTYEFYLGTTSILSGKKLIEELCPSIVSNLAKK